MRKRGVNVSLATDGAKANNRLDMFDVMKFASLLHKGVSSDPRMLPPGEILDMATRAGAAAAFIGRPHGGHTRRRRAGVGWHAVACTRFG